jgi:hypothetical protein
MARNYGAVKNAYRVMCASVPFEIHWYAISAQDVFIVSAEKLAIK